MDFFDIERIAHSVKTALACCIGFIVGRILSPHGGQWIIITVVIVMCAQLYVGSVISKGFLRLIGTFCGSLFAVIILITLGPTNFAIIFALILSSLIFSYLAVSEENLSIVGTLGAATTAIILLTPGTNLTIAAERCLEITIGILIATLTSQFVLPIHARTHLRITQAKTIELIKNYYIAIIVKNTPLDNQQIEDNDEAIAKTLIKQRQLAKESAREPLGVAFSSKLFVHSLHCEKEILRAITFIRLALANIEDPNQLTNSIAFQTFNQQTIAAFDYLIKLFSNDLPSTPIELPDLKTIKEDIYSKTINATSNELVYINGLLFACTLLVQFLQELSQVYLHGQLDYHGKILENSP